MLQATSTHLLNPAVFFLFLIYELDQDFGLYSQLLFSFYF